MNSAGSPIPIYFHLRVYMDPWWYAELGHKGLDINTDLLNFPKIMDIVSREQFPIHSRRMRVFKSEQKGDTMSFLREIIENIRLADWRTFTEEATACHIFMAFTKDEEAKRACYKILSELPQGDTKALMARISAIEAFPDNKLVYVKPVID